ncbi:hypothetical protein NMG60_11016284 [Bertholletia excelsa]
MEDSYKQPDSEKLQIIRHPLYRSCAKFKLPWFQLRVFYIRISNIFMDDLTPQCLTLNHIPLSSDTLLEVNGVRCDMNSEGLQSLLRIDRADKRSEEATFISTDSIRFSGSVRFEVIHNEELVIHGLLEMSSASGDSEGGGRKWSMECELGTNGFLKGRQVVDCEVFSPSIEVYVAGCFEGTPIILTRTLEVGSRNKQSRNGMLDSIPENEATEFQKNMDSRVNDQQVADYRSYSSHKPENDDDYRSMYLGRTEYMEGEDGELSWFNAGVRVGVGIGLGVCLGVGIGVGLLVRTYQATSRTFKRRIP